MMMAQPEHAETRVHELEREIEALRSQRDSAWMQLETMRRSWSWRVTWPMRRLARSLPRR